ncbi:hypothetical protein FWK35_00021685 [Aphis craccivora]|uniref:Uncharacterized protein n=1 Tax=Aphis craccivora TaxID=307492 RepID=A0A6G0Z798_APHCR|nr:hypothetical protein FWK35_00021685 [Aphis craccivora]
MHLVGYLKFKNQYNSFLNSERSDECIDFTMLCVFFCVSVHENVSK